jgi:hypothetical protein
MTVPVGRTFNRYAGLILAGMLAACISFGSTLPTSKAGSADEAGTAGMLPNMMDASSSYTDTGAVSPATPTVQENGPSITAPATPAGLNATVASGEFSPASTNRTAGSNHQGCVPEPVSVILMTGGLLGLIAVRRFRK